MLSRAFRMALIAVGLVTLPALSQAQTSDPQAVAILQQSLVAAGGTRGLATIQDFTATGTIT